MSEQQQNPNVQGDNVQDPNVQEDALEAASLALNEGRSVYVTDIVDRTQISQETWQLVPGATTDEDSPRELYYFAGDEGPGDTNGDGVADVFHLYEGEVLQPSASASEQDASDQPTSDPQRTGEEQPVSEQSDPNEQPAGELREEDVTLSDALDDRIAPGERLADSQREDPPSGAESVPKHAE